jgi:hypothetical protein
LNTLKDNLKDTKAVAPYAQTVVSFVPGVGQGIAGAIGAGLALANGQNITAALAEGVKGSLPGGPIAVSAFSVGQAAMQGKKITNIALAAIPGMTDQQRTALASGLNAANDIAHGKRVDHALVDAALKNVPPEAQKALQIGLAIGHGQNLQKVVKGQVMNFSLGKIADLGKKVTGTNPVLSAGASMIKTDPSLQSGFHIGVGVVSAPKKLPAAILAGIRKQLSSAEKKGFDMAVSAHKGITAEFAPPSLTSPREKFGYYLTHGLTGLSKGNKAAVMKTIASDNSTRAGATVAINQIATKRKGLWQRIKEVLHLVPKQTAIAALSAKT